MPEKSSNSPSREQGSDASAFFQGYNTLPAELKDYIFKLACAYLAPPSSSSTSHPLYDVPACLNLSLVNKDLNERVRPALYRQVSITRPSALYALQQTLEAHPEWGKLIKNLHIGNTTALPTHWWPLSDAYPEPLKHDLNVREEDSQSYAWIASSLDRGQLPSGCGDRNAWALDRPPSGRRDSAIHQALQIIQESLDVDLVQGPLEGQPLKIGAIFEAQAALDLYLNKVQALEKAVPELMKNAEVDEQTGTCAHCYPDLVITPILQPPRVARPVPKGALVLSRAQLLRHLARPGATTDRFDHPLTVARSGYNLSVLQPPGKGFSGYREGDPAEYEIEDDEFHVDDTDWPDRRSLRFADLREVESGSGIALNDAVLSTATLGLCQDLARAVLKLTPGVKNLSLTGALQRSLMWGPFKQEGVRRMTFGPCPPWWDVVTEMDMKDLKLVEELRIGGTPLYEPDRDLIATMRKLRILEWSMGEEYPPALEGIDEDLRALINTPVPADDASQADYQGGQDHSAGDEAQQRPADDGELEEIAAPAARSNSPPLTIVRLHTTDVDRVLAAAPSLEVREAWLQGRAVEGIPRRLQLVAKNIESRSNRAPHLDDTEPAWDVMYQEGRDWWLEGAV